MRKALMVRETGGPGGCAVCSHKRQRVINEALIAMVPLSLLAQTYGMSGAALSRHRKNHISRATAGERIQRMLDHLLAKCDEFSERELERAADDEVIAVIDDFYQEVLK